MKDFGKLLSIVAQIIAYILAALIVYQIIKAIVGGTWQIEDIILAIVIFNLTITFGIGGYLIHLSTKMSRTTSH